MLLNSHQEHTQNVNYNAKQKGENGSPCLNPLETLAHPLAQPFTKIEKPIKDMQPLIQCLQLELKSFLSKA